MMQTQSTGAGSFAHFDLARVPSPCFVVDEVKLRDNLAMVQAVSHASGADVLLALKAFSMWSLARWWRNIWPEAALRACGKRAWHGRILAAG